MTVFRTFDPQLINRIANIPTIKEMIFLNDPQARRYSFDYHDAIAQADRWIVVTDGDDAVAMFEVKTPTVFEGHFFFGPTCRGFKAIRIARLMVDWLFQNTRLIMLVGETPIENRGACFMAKKIGMVSDGTMTKPKGSYEYHHLLRSEWDAPR